jgi:amidase
LRHGATALCAVIAEASTMLNLENAAMSDIVRALADGQITATALTKFYLARIEAYDRNGPLLNSVRELNPDALAITGKLNGIRPSLKRPLAGWPPYPGEGQHRYR